MGFDLLVHLPRSVGLGLLHQVESGRRHPTLPEQTLHLAFICGRPRAVAVSGVDNRIARHSSKRLGRESIQPQLSFSLTASEKGMKGRPLAFFQETGQRMFESA